MIDKTKAMLAVGFLSALPLFAGAEVEPVPGATQAPPSTALSAGPFDRKFEMHGITFRVASPNSASGNRVAVTTTGLTIDNSPWVQEVDGVVTGAEVADINADLSPEIYVYVQGRDKEARAALVAYSANKKRSLSAITLPELAAQPGATKGYCGHDEMAVVESVIARRFRICDENGQPSGKWRQLQYKLVPGEAGWQLRVDRMIEF